MRKFLRLNQFDIFSVILFMILILTVNYTFANYYFNNSNDIPFGLSDNAVVLKSRNGNNVPYSDIIDLDKNTDIRIITTTKNKKVIGIYDPSMYYYVNSTKFTLPVALRYFSKEDYSSKANTSIAINQCSLGESQGEDMDNIGLRFNTTIINCLESSPLANNDTVIIKNLFSIPNQSNSTIYIDSSRINQIKDVQKDFEKNGFVKVNTKKLNINIVNSLYQSYQSKYPKFLIISSFTLLMLYIVICYSIIEKNKNKMYINIVNGGSFAQILYHMNINTLIKNITYCCISSCLLIVYLIYLNKNYFSFLNYITVFLCYLFYEVSVYVTMSYFIYRKLK